MAGKMEDFIVVQNALNLKMVESLGRIEQAQTDMSHRLFGGDGQKGLLPYLVDSAKENAEKIDVRVGKLETWKTGTVKWVGGVITVLTLEGTAVGFYLNHVAGKVSAIINLKR